MEALQRRVDSLQQVSKKQSPQLTDPEQGLTEEEEASAVVDSLNVVMLAVYWGHRASVTCEAWDIVGAVAWSTIGLLLALLEIVCLLSLGISVNWQRCITSDDCPTGQACVRLFNTLGDLIRPVCQDCNYLVPYFD